MRSAGEVGSENRAKVGKLAAKLGSKISSKSTYIANPTNPTNLFYKAIDCK